MRLSSLLRMALLAGMTAGCRPQGAASYPGAQRETGGATEADAAPSELPGDGTTPGEVPSAPPAPKAPETVGEDGTRTVLAGISLSAMGVAGAGMGGFLLGWSSGTCDGAESTCATGVALSIVGALCVAGGAVPLVMGASLWTPSAPAAKAGQASPWPDVIVGPAAASARWRF